MNIIDISKDILSCPVYEGDPSPYVERIANIKDGDECNLSCLFTCVHTGTHCDSPLHYIENGKSVDALELESFIGRCTVLSVPEGEISKEYVMSFFPKDCERILIKSNGRAYFTKESAEYAAGNKLKLIGTDSDSVGSPEDERNPHLAFLKKDIVIIENLDLSSAEDGEYFLFSQPLKLSGTDGAPVRAVLIRI